MAQHLGARVTAVASTANIELLRSLGADHTLDYTTEDPRRADTVFDVIIDPVGRSTFDDFRNILRPTGRHIFIEAGLREMWQALITPRRPGPTVLFGVAGESRAALEGLLRLVGEGALRPVIGHRFSLTETVEAHRLVDRRHRRGAVIVEVRA